MKQRPTALTVSEWTYKDSMSGQQRRRWSNIEPTLGHDHDPPGIALGNMNDMIALKYQFLVWPSFLSEKSSIGYCSVTVKLSALSDASYFHSIQSDTADAITSCFKTIKNPFRFKI